MSRSLATLLGVAVACWLVPACVRRPPASHLSSRASEVCWDCFWQHQPPALREELRRFYASRETRDPLLASDAEHLAGRIGGDPQAVCGAFRRLRRAVPRIQQAQRRLIAAEELAFTAEECGEDAAPFFRSAARAARAAGDEWKANVYAATAEGRFVPEFGETAIRRDLRVPANPVAYVLGESVVRLTAGSRVGVQVERTVRDWLSAQVRYDFSARPVGPRDLLGYHEGARLGDLLPTGVVAVPLQGTLAARRDDRWLAPDERGVFRFEVLPDKIQYPATRAARGLALLPDTHGVSALVEQAARGKVDLVIACGDSPDKAKAAYHLARLGIAVWFPCDRFVGDLLGHDARATLIGSAPARVEGHVAVIGDRPVSFSVSETIVVEDTSAHGNERYHDAAWRYYSELARAVPLRLERVQVEGAGKAARLVARARELGARAVALRVADAEDAGALREWLAQSTENRAVLFHSAPYPDGERLFRDFPRQTTFGDPRPRFIGG